VRGRIFISAIKNIKPGEELCYDYGKEYWNEYIKPKGCLCPSCVEKKQKTTTEK
jgi:SET domain-containing protein